MCAAPACPPVLIAAERDTYPLNSPQIRFPEEPQCGVMLKKSGNSFQVFAWDQGREGLNHELTQQFVAILGIPTIQETLYKMYPESCDLDRVIVVWYGSNLHLQNQVQKIMQLFEGVRLGIESTNPVMTQESMAKLQNLLSTHEIHMRIGFGGFLETLQTSRCVLLPPGKEAWNSLCIEILTRKNYWKANRRDLEVSHERWLQGNVRIIEYFASMHLVELQKKRIEIKKILGTIDNIEKYFLPLLQALEEITDPIEDGYRFERAMYKCLSCLCYIQVRWNPEMEQLWVERLQIYRAKNPERFAFIQRVMKEKWGEANPMNVIKELSPPSPPSCPFSDVLPSEDREGQAHPAIDDVPEAIVFCWSGERDKEPISLRLPPSRDLQTGGLDEALFSPFNREKNHDGLDFRFLLSPNGESRDPWVP